MKVIVLNENEDTLGLNETYADGYHFTTLNGLIGILKDNVMKATNRQVVLDVDHLLKNTRMTNKDLDVPIKNYLKKRLPKKHRNYINHLNILDMSLRDCIKNRKIDYIVAKSLNPDLIEFSDDPEKFKTMDIFMKDSSWSYTRDAKGFNSLRVRPDTVRIKINVEKVSHNNPVKAFNSVNRDGSDHYYFQHEDRVVGDTKDIIYKITAIDFLDCIGKNSPYSNEMVWVAPNYTGTDIKSNFDKNLFNSYGLQELYTQSQIISELNKIPNLDNPSKMKSVTKELIDSCLMKFSDYIKMTIPRALSSNSAFGLAKDIKVQHSLSSISEVKKFIKEIVAEHNKEITKYNKQAKKEGKRLKELVNIEIGTYSLHGRAKSKLESCFLSKSFVDKLKRLKKTGVTEKLEY